MSVTRQAFIFPLLEQKLLVWFSESRVLWGLEGRTTGRCCKSAQYLQGFSQKSPYLSLLPSADFFPGLFA